jgi:pseudomonalisin
MPKRPLRRALIAAIATGILLAGAVNLSAASPGTPVLPAVVQLAQNILPGLDKLVATALPEATTPLHLGIGLAPSDPAGENALFNSLYDPSSSLYHHFLTPDQVNARFGVAPERVQATVDWLNSAGLQVEHVGSGGTFLEVVGGVGQIDRLLGTTVKSFTAGGTNFLANVSAPSVPGALGVISILGLNTLQHFSTPNSTTSAATARGRVATTPSLAGLYTDSYTPQDLWSLYQQPAGNQGQGQSMAIFGEGATDPVIANLRRFEDMNGLPHVPVVVKRTGAGPWNDNSGAGEWAIDTQASTGMAPQVREEQLYFGSSLSDAEVATMFSTWVSDPNGPRQASASFGECETNPLNAILGNPLLSPLPNAGQALGNNLEPVAEQTLLQGTLEGRTLFVSTGDTGSSCPVAVLPIVGAGNGVLNQVLPLQNYPAASRYVVAVGGTVLYSKEGVTPRQRALEYAWPFGGGGSAFFIPRPDYQKGVSAIDRPCLVGPNLLQIYTLGTVCRGLPDVSALSGDVISNGYTIVSDMVPGTSGGTSLAAPLWMGMWTRIQAAAPDQAHGLGFANPLLYQKGESSHYDQDFHDITVGTNGLYLAGKGWDYVSGFGTPNLTNLMTDIDGTTTPATTEGPAAVPAALLAIPCGAAFVSPSGNASDPVTGAQLPSMDITRGELDVTPDGTALRAVLTITGLDGRVPSVGTAADYAMYWTYNGKTWFAHTKIDRLGGVTFDDGMVGGGKGSSHSDAGRLVPGNPGLVEVDVPLGHVGSPPAGARLMYPYGESWLELATLSLTTDEAGGQDDAVAQPCGSAPPAPAAAPPAAPNPLPVPLPIPLPLGPIGGLGLGVPAPAPLASPAPGLTLFGITLLGPAPARPTTSSGLLDQVFHLLW